MRPNHSLELDDCTFDVDLNYRIEGIKINSAVASVGATLSLPYKTKWGFKKVAPGGEFKYEIKLTGDPENDTELSQNDFDDNSSPIKFMINHCDEDSNGTFTVDGCVTKLKLFFDGSTVRNCPKTLTEDQLFNLPFQLIICDEDDESCFTFEDSLKVKIKRFAPKLLFSFKGIENQLVYSEKDKKVLVGELVVEHNAPFSCAPDVVDQSFELGCILEASHIQKKAQGKQPIKSSDRKDILLLRKDETEYAEYKVENLKVGSKIVFDVFLDMTAVQNPLSDDCPDKYYPTIDGNIVGQFDLHRNKVLTKRKTFFLMPTVQDGFVSHDITDCSKCDLGRLLIARQENTVYTMKLAFSNDADATDPRYPNAAVLVWGVQVKLEGELDRIILRSGKKLKDIFCFHSNENRWKLNPKIGKRCELDMEIKAEDIVDIIPSKKENETFVKLKMTLEYRAKEDANGAYHSKWANGNINDIDKSKHTCELSLRLEKQPRSEWLCVDFGTSAVVAAFAKDIRDEDKSLIDLKKLKKHLLNIFYGKESNKNSVEDEDEKLISSTICFNYDIDTEDYQADISEPEDLKKCPVWLSPSAADIKMDYLLPCLKTIIGYRYLPRIFTERAINQFRYRRGQDEIKLIDEDGKPTELMQVEVVSRIIYRQLFKYYLSHRLNKSYELTTRKVNKLVLSVPNTYTPRDIQRVKNLVRESMPNIHPEYLHTISESDAVACYYVSHHQRFLDSIKEDDLNKKEQLLSEENVLVYDMGAGTLDLTWLNIKTTQNDNGRDVDVTIRGKMGINKAGNYLDYELATILYNLYNERIPKKKGSIDNNDYSAFNIALQLDRSTGEDAIRLDSQQRTNLKNYVKELKKRLSDENAEVPALEFVDKRYFEDSQSITTGQENSHGIKLHMNDILNHRHFKEIIKEMTEQVLSRFGKRYGDENGKIDIDVLIFSGRSTSLKAIRKGVEEHISEICHRPDDLLYADLCSGCLRRSTDQPADVNNSLLKTVVSQGALAYATMFARNGSNFRLKNENYYATYGLVEYHNDGFKFVPLIGKDADGMDEGTKNIKSKKYKVNTKLVRQVDLIQSYSSDVESDYENGNFDTISKLSEIFCEGYDNPTAQLIMSTQNEGGKETTLKFIFGQGSDSFNPHDDFNNLSLRKSLWPVIFDDGENPNR